MTLSKHYVFIFRRFPIPPTASWWIDQVLSPNISHWRHESYQRQLVDSSSPFYKQPPAPVRILPTAVGRCFKSFLQSARQPKLATPPIPRHGGEITMHFSEVAKLR